MNTKLIQTVFDNLEEWTGLYYPKTAKNEAFFKNRLWSIDEEKLDQEDLVNLLTTGTTWEFRHSEQWDELETYLRVSNHVKFRVWNSAVSEGADAYTMALTLEKLDLDYSILATDINSKFLRNAKKFHINTSKVPEKYKDLALPVDKDRSLLLSSIRDKVEFKRNNLLNCNSVEGKFDIITCRNVLMYFRPEKALEVIENLKSKMKNGSILLLSPIESYLLLRDSDFKKIGTAMFKYYKRYP